MFAESSRTAFLNENAVAGWLLKGRKVAIDTTTLEANSAMRTIVRRADVASYQKYLTKLAKSEGVTDPTPEDLGRMASVSTVRV